MSSLLTRGDRWTSACSSCQNTLKLGAMTGPRSFRLAGEIADGVHVACAHSSTALSFAARSVREGADRAGRRLDSSFDLCASVLGAISRTATTTWRPASRTRWAGRGRDGGPGPGRAGAG
jgi:alkanesulfonate monooxygenase SsuD/methylene tetrahydromethanopterin reductase-like flavin-dependent oxidoreductase (luciferase family)